MGDSISIRVLVHTLTSILGYHLSKEKDFFFFKKSWFWAHETPDSDHHFLPLGMHFNFGDDLAKVADRVEMWSGDKKAQNMQGFRQQY